MNTNKKWFRIFTGTAVDMKTNPALWRLVKYTAFTTLLTALAIVFVASIVGMVNTRGEGMFGNIMGMLLFLPFAALLVLFASLPGVVLAWFLIGRGGKTSARRTILALVTTSVGCLSVGLVLVRPWNGSVSTQWHDIRELLAGLWVFGVPASFIAAKRTLWAEVPS